MSEQAVARGVPLQPGTFRRGIRAAGYGLGIAAAVVIAVAWWTLLAWGVLALVLQAWRLVA